MSIDGKQLVAIVRLRDEDLIERRTLAAMRSFAHPPADDERLAPRVVVLGYEFGYGESRPVGFELLDELVELPWRKVPSYVSDAEIRALRPTSLAAASLTLDGLRRRPHALARRIAHVCEEEDREGAAYECLKRDPRTRPEDAGFTGSRLADVFMQLRRMVKRGAGHGEAVGLAIRIEPY
jgi:hypothetical protein